ncbi:MAG: calcium/sodium antiporter [Acidobacteria bacterium]|nr:calcium/sodium antiporter [Acidobacteriota bacterium]
MTYILFLLGFVVLIKGADLLVEGASSVAKKFNISNLVIGLTIVAFGTSAPELVVNVIAALEGKTELAFGNILGSNIANVLLILGVSATICALTVKRNTVWIEIPLSMLAVLVVAAMANDALIDRVNQSIISRSEGLVLIGFFFVFLYYTINIAKSNEGEVVEVVEQYSTTRSIIMVIIGLIGLVFGGNWIVDGAVKMALAFGLSQTLIGLTIVSIGTSLPELATSAMAAYRRESDIAIGNVVGSNIFNIFWILAVSSTLQPIELQPANNFDISVLIFANLMLFACLFIGKRHVLDRWQGIIFLLVYIIYIIYLVKRG